jgi:hypothetical protein
VLDALFAQPWLRPALDVLRLLLFCGFVALGLFARKRAAERRAADPLLAYTLAVSLAVGISQIEAWPFSNWALVHGLAPARMASWQIEGIDASGRAWPVDARVLQPLAPEEFGAWMFARVPGLPAESRARLGRFLLDRAEAGRRRLREGRQVGTNEAVLGPLAAPFHFQQRRVWHAPDDVPAIPFAAVVVSVLEWDVGERRRDDSRVTRRTYLRYPSS